MKNMLLVFLSFFLVVPLYASYSAKPKKSLFALDLSKVANPHKVEFELSNLLIDVEEMLPKSFKDSFKEQIHIIMDSPKKDQKGVMGWVDYSSRAEKRMKNFTLHLNKSMLANIGTEKGQDLIRRIVIHESTHLFDNHFVRLGRELEFEKYCQSLPQVIIRKEGDKLIYGPNNQSCVRFLANTYSVSESPLFLTLSGWNITGTIFKSREQINKNELRSVDSYEYTNPRESFAVNMEFFLTDEEYQCRRPALYKYFAELFDHRPFANSSCQSYTKVTTSSSAMSEGTPQTVDLDFKRLYQVHYLFASEGDQMMSKWGHAMFRLVMCRPGRELGPKCLDDIAYHVVLSFRANVDDAQIDYLKGLNGGYDSQMFILSMKDVIDEYTKGEFRDLLSIPLKYTADQRRLFLQSTLEQYWSYLGSYYFISNNCATETMRLIRIAAFDDYLIQEKDVVTPLGLMELLEKNKIADTSVLKDRKQAIKKGYLFPRASIELEKVYQEVKGKLGVTYKDFKEFAEKSTAQDRHYRSLRVRYSNKADARRYNAKLLMLENHIKTYRMQQLVNTAAHSLAKQEKVNLDEMEMIKKKLNDYNFALKKIGADNQVQKGYGIPVINDLNTNDQEQKSETLAQMGEIKKELASYFNQLFPDEIEELNLIQENIYQLMQEIKNSL